jgi:hypothetical protein
LATFRSQNEPANSADEAFFIAYLAIINGLSGKAMKLSNFLIKGFVIQIVSN